MLRVITIKPRSHVSLGRRTATSETSIDSGFPVFIAQGRNTAAIPNSKFLEAGTLDISFKSNLFEEP
jgi:hypothetical protein